MNGFDFTALKNDLIENPTARCACALVLDSSGSMAGRPISELNAGVRQFLQELHEDDFASYAVEIGIFSFGASVQEVLPFTPAHQVHSHTALEADGGTPMGRAVAMALERLEERKKAYKRAGISYYQPWLVLMSDGGPTDEWETSAQRLRQMDEEHKIVSLPVGIGHGAALGILGQFSTRSVKALSDMKFREFFQWLSQSMERVSQSTPGTGVTLPATGGWESIG